MSQTPLARILIVDDEVAHAKALCDTLKDNGYETTGCNSGQAALALLAQTSFDLLLTDLMMPEMDGITLLRKSREIDDRLVGILMTGQGTIDSAVEAMKAGALDYILKPFKLSFILPVLSRARVVHQLRADNAALEKKVSERTAELETANKELEAFSYSVSHDLRAPLRAVDGFSSILLQTYEADLPAEAQRLLKNVIGSAKRMGQLIDDLLNFSRFARHPLSKRTTNLTALAKQVVQDLRQLEPDRQMEIEIKDLPDAFCDSSLIKQVLVNLLSNAVKFTRKKQTTLIEVGSKLEPKEKIYFVRDNGAGFDMRYYAKLFGVFQRLHRIEDFDGTGVGLSIVQRIVQRHGGRIWAESVLEQGATFYFALPE